METKPLISFVIPTKNRIAWLPEAVVSILGQTEPNIELIVVNDGSTDGTKEFLDSWLSKDPRVKVVHNEKSMGAGPSRNIGTDIASSEIVAQFDDDDICVSERATITLEWFKNNPDSELVNFPYVSCGYFNEIIEAYDGEQFDAEKFKESGTVNYFANPTCAYRKSSMKDIGYVAENELHTDDYQFIKNWINSGKKIDFRPGDPVIMHRVLPDSMMVKHRGWDPKWVQKR